MIRGCTAIITRAKCQAITRPMMQAMDTAETVWITKDNRSPMSDRTFNTNNTNIMSGQVLLLSIYS
uniref:Uncharacterized protein n=1 Tax=Arundo donax TaxID=35708 RepID=A0A0A9C6Q9_ARUDO